MRADGEGGILFYIILALVGLIVSFLQNKAKPKQPTTTEIPENEEPRDIWKELMEWEDEPEYRKVEQPVSQADQEKALVVTKASIEGPALMDARQEGISALPSTFLTSESAYQITEEPATFYADFIKDTEITDASEEKHATGNFVFNLRDAVVYSEILNRKY